MPTCCRQPNHLSNSACLTGLPTLYKTTSDIFSTYMRKGLMVLKTRPQESHHSRRRCSWKSTWPLMWLASSSLSFPLSTQLGVDVAYIVLSTTPTIDVTGRRHGYGSCLRCHCSVKMGGICDRYRRFGWASTWEESAGEMGNVGVGPGAAAVMKV